MFVNHSEHYYTGLVGKIYAATKILYKWRYDLFLTYSPLESRAPKQQAKFSTHLASS